MITKYYVNADLSVGFTVEDDDGNILRKEGEVHEASTLLANEAAYELAKQALVDAINASIAQSAIDYAAANASIEIVRAQIRTKLIAGTPLTADEAALLI